MMAPSKEQGEGKTAAHDSGKEGTKDSHHVKGEKGKNSNGASVHSASSSTALSRSGSSKTSAAPKGDASPGMALTRPEISRGPVWLETLDGDIEEVEREVALLSPLVQREVLRFGHGASRESPVVLPKQVSPGVLKLILEYCRFHRVPGRSDKERKLFDEKFIRLDTRRLCELTSAADSLDMKPLVDLTSRALARMIEGKTPEEIRETFHLPDDLTEEEKLEPVKNATDDPRIRLLNRLYARKRKELQEKKLLKSVSTESDDKPRDERSVDDLLSFIDGNNHENKAGKSGKTKKKKKHKKKELAEEHAEDTSSAALEVVCAKEDVLGEKKQMATGLVGQVADVPSIGKVNVNVGDDIIRDSLPALVSSSRRQREIFAETEFDDDDGIDPAMREKLDREVEDFARRLNVDWQDRKEEILALASSSREHEIRISNEGRGLPTSVVAVETSDLGLSHGNGIGHPRALQETDDAPKKKGKRPHQQSQSLETTQAGEQANDDSLPADDFSDGLARALVQGLPNWPPQVGVLPVDSGQGPQSGGSMVVAAHTEHILAEALADRRDEPDCTLAGGVGRENQEVSLWERGPVGNSLWSYENVEVHARTGVTGSLPQTSSLGYGNRVELLHSSNALQNSQTSTTQPGSLQDGRSTISVNGSGVDDGGWIYSMKNGSCCSPALVGGLGGGGVASTWAMEPEEADLIPANLSDRDWEPPLDLRHGATWGSTDAPPLDAGELAGFLQSLVQILQLESQIGIVLGKSLTERPSTDGSEQVHGGSPMPVPLVPLIPHLLEGGLQVSHRLSSGGVLSVSLSGFHPYSSQHSPGAPSLQDSLTPQPVPSNLHRVNRADIDSVF